MCNTENIVKKLRFCCPSWEMPPNISLPFGEPRDLLCCKDACSENEKRNVCISWPMADERHSQRYSMYGRFSTFGQCRRKHREVTPNIDCLELRFVPSKLNSLRITPLFKHTGGRYLLFGTLIFIWAGRTLFTIKQHLQGVAFPLALFEQA